MSHDPASPARAACEALCHAFGPLADAREADALAALFAPDAVFDRLGTPLRGRDAIRDVIAGRAPGVWTRHVCSNVNIVVAADGRSATGTADLDLERGQDGIEAVERLRGAYTDEFELTDEGWKFRRRAVRLVD